MRSVAFHIETNHLFCFGEQKKWVVYIWDKELKNGPSEICGGQPLEY